MGRIIGFVPSQEVDRIANQAVIPAMNETSEAMRAVAARVARRKTGAMAEGWQAIPATRDGFTIRGGIRNDVPYTLFQDKGTSRGITPNNMSGAAIDAEAPNLPARIKARL